MMDDLVFLKFAGVPVAKIIRHYELEQRFPNFFGPPPPWFHMHTHSAPLPFLKKNINALLFPLLFYI
jgi:hypothetical protein